MLTAQACDADVSTSQLGDLAFEVERAFAGRDQARLTASFGALEGAIPCVRERLAPTQVAAVHRAFGLLAFVNDDSVATLEAFEAARHVDPNYEFPEGFVSDGHPLRSVFYGIPGDPPPQPRQLPDPVEGWVWVDGRQGSQAPISRPFLFQRFDAAGMVVDTRWVAARSEPPRYAVEIESEANPVGVALSAGVGLRILPNPSDVESFGSVELGLLIAPSERAEIDIGVGIAGASAMVDGASGVAGLGSVRVGANYHLGAVDSVHFFLGGTSWVGMHATRFSPGLLGVLGADVPLGGPTLRARFDGGAASPHVGGVSGFPVQTVFGIHAAMVIPF